MNRLLHLFLVLFCLTGCGASSPNKVPCAGTVSGSVTSKIDACSVGAVADGTRTSFSLDGTAATNNLDGPHCIFTLPAAPQVRTYSFNDLIDADCSFTIGTKTYFNVKGT